MDINKEFKSYLKKWCKDNNKPEPTEGSFNKIWQMAWQDFMKTELVNHWQDQKEDYWNMQLLTKEESKQRENKKEEVTNKTTSTWDQVKNMLN